MQTLLSRRSHGAGEHPEPGLVRIRYPAAVGFAAHPCLCPVHPGRNHGGPLAHVRPLGTAWRARGQRLGHRHLGHPVRHHRRAPVPRVLVPGRILRTRLRRDRGPLADPADPAWRTGHLGCSGAGRRGCLDRLPPLRGETLRLPGRCRTGAAAGPGCWPVGQLLQPGTLRRANHPSVGPADRRRQRQFPGGRSRGHSVPPHVPL